MICPPGHTAYLSQTVAENAVTLHQMAFRHCGGYAPWPCGDHWHVGHPSLPIGQACKADPLHQAMGRRLQRVPGHKRPR